MHRSSSHWICDYIYLRSRLILSDVWAKQSLVVVNFARTSSRLTAYTQGTTIIKISFYFRSQKSELFLSLFTHGSFSAPFLKKDKYKTYFICIVPIFFSYTDHNHWKFKISGFVILAKTSVLRAKTGNITFGINYFVGMYVCVWEEGGGVGRGRSRVRSRHWIPPAIHDHNHWCLYPLLFWVFILHPLFISQRCFNLFSHCSCILDGEIFHDRSFGC